MSVDELAQKIGKNRATVYRYENTDIENLPVSILEPIAKALKTTPAALMGWEESTGAVRSTPDEHLLDSFHQLNSDGQELAIDYVDALAEKPKYQRTDEE